MPVFFNDRTRSVVVSARVRKCFGGNALTFSKHAQEEVLGADAAVVQVPGLFLRQNKDPASTISEILEHFHQGARIQRQNHADETASRCGCTVSGVERPARIAAIATTHREVSTSAIRRTTTVADVQPAPIDTESYSSLPVTSPQFALTSIRPWHSDLMTSLSVLGALGASSSRMRAP